MILLTYHIKRESHHAIVPTSPLLPIGHERRVDKSAGEIERGDYVLRAGKGPILRC